MTRRLSDKNFNRLPPAEAAVCQNCTWQGHADKLEPVYRPFERWAEGDTMWAGDCPKCGATCFTVYELERQQRPRKAAGAMLAVLESLATHEAWARSSFPTAVALHAAIKQARDAGFRPDGF